MKAEDTREQVYLARESQEAVAAAELAGMKVIRRGQWELLIDLDDYGIAHFKKRLSQMSGMISDRQVRRWTWWHSKGMGIHVRVELCEIGAAPSPCEAVALQAALGSDHKREMLAMCGIRIGNPHYSVLFQPAGAEVHEGDQS